MLEITNQATGDGLSKPGFWMDGNLHAGEVMGAEVCLNNIDTLVKGYGNDPFITNLVDTRTMYIMPKLNPDGSDYYLHNPDGMRSSVRPHDSDRDGALDEDPPEDLDGDGYILQMRVRDETGPMKTSPEDSRLMVGAEVGETGEWRTYSEGIDNDGDGRFNEDGVGGLDINRNWPGQWQQEHIQGGAGPVSSFGAGDPVGGRVPPLPPERDGHHQPSHGWKLRLPAPHGSCISIRSPGKNSPCPRRIWLSSNFFGAQVHRAHQWPGRDTGLRTGRSAEVRSHLGGDDRMGIRPLRRPQLGSGDGILRSLLRLR